MHSFYKYSLESYIVVINRAIDRITTKKDPEPSKNEKKESKDDEIKEEDKPEQEGEENQEQEGEEK